MRKSVITIALFFFGLLTSCGEHTLHAQWQVLSQIPAPEKVNYIYFLDNENAPNIGFAGGNALWKTTDRGKTWINCSITTKFNSIVTCMTFANANEGWLTTANTNVSKGNVYHSTDGGLTWNLLSQLRDASYSCIFYNKTFQRIFLTSRTEDCSVSTDNGMTWASFGTPSHNGFAFLNDTVGICSPWQATYLFTTDGGANWNTTLQKLEVWQPLAVRGNNGFYALSEITGGILKSLDSGLTWIPMTGSSANKVTGQIGGTLPRLYFRAVGSGFYKSIDSGLTWYSICGPSGDIDSRYYVQNDSIYAGSGNIIWFNPNPVNGLPSQIACSIPSIETKECIKTSVPLNLKIHIECASITILSARISDPVHFSINPSPKLPLSPIQDISLDDFVLYTPTHIGYDTATLRITYTITGLRVDTVLTVIGHTIEAPIQDVEDPESLDLGVDSLCKSIDRELTVTSLCHSFDLVSLELEDTTNFTMASLYQYPLTVDQEKSVKLRIRFVPKSEIPYPFTTSLVLTYQIGSFTLIKKIPVTSGGIFNPNSFPAEAYLGNKVCEYLDTTLNLTNRLCEPITVTALTFLDSSALQYFFPQTPFTILPGETMKSHMTLSSMSPALVTNRLLVTYTFRGSQFSAIIPIQYTTSNNFPAFQLSATRLPFGTTNICHAKTRSLVLSNLHCFDITISKIDWITPFADLTIPNLPHTPFLLPSGANDTLLINYAPTVLGNWEIKLRIQIEYNGKTYDSLITVTGTASSSAVCSFDEQLVSFDTVSMCLPKTRDVYLINDNCDSILVSEFTSLTGKDFVIAPPLPLWLHAGDSIQFTITYSPSTAGVSHDSITVLGQTKSGSVQAQSLILSGYGEQEKGKLSFVPREFDFQTIAICSDSLLRGQLTNTGCKTITIDSVIVFGDPDYKISANIFNGLRIDPKETLPYSLDLHPTEKGIRKGYCIVASTDGAVNNRDTIPFLATVTDGTKLISSPSTAIDFGTTTLCDQKDTEIIVRNSGCDTLRISGLGLHGSGFGTTTTFPLMVMPQSDTTIDLFTVLDTVGGKTLSQDTLNLISNADNALVPIPLRRAIMPAIHRDIGMYLDAAVKTAGDLSMVRYDIKEVSDKTFAGAGITDATFDLNYNSDLLEFDQNLSTNVTSSDGKRFTISDPKEIDADANSVLATIAFTVNLTKDSTTSIRMTTRTDTTALPCGILTLSTGGFATFDYNYLCGERSIAGFMNGRMPLEIISLHPNPAQDEIELDVRAAMNQRIPVEIFNALGVNVFSNLKNVAAGSNTIRINTQRLSGGMYVLHIGAASQSFVKMK